MTELDDQDEFNIGDDPMQAWMDRVNQAEEDGVLTYKRAPIGTFVRITSGKHRGRIVIKPHPFAIIDDEPITWLMPTMTWINVSEIENDTCTRVSYGTRE